MVVIGQNVSKMGALIANNTGVPINYFLVLAYVILLLRGFVWIHILSTIKLRVASPLISITYVLMLPFSHYIFGEEITETKMIGCFLITCGVIVVTLGEKASSGTVFE